MMYRHHVVGWAASLLVVALLASADEIHQAVRDGDISRLDALLDEGASNLVNQALVDGITPLHLAAALNKDAVTGFLVHRGADLHASTSAGFTPLHWAASRDAAASAHILITAGADVNSATPNGITPLHWASGKGATNVLRLLILAGANVTAETAEGMKPLHWAVAKHADDAAHLLLFQEVSDEFEKNPPTLPVRIPEPDDPTPPPEEPPLLPPPPDPATEPPVTDPLITMRPLRPLAEPLPGRTLIVPIGIGETLVLAWIKDLNIWFGKYEITNAQYRKFKPRHSSRFRGKLQLNGPDQPVVYVSWNDAVALCSWLNKAVADRIPTGHTFRLPTHREWITVAKNGDARRYPWGDAWPPTYGNFADQAAAQQFPDTRSIQGYNDGSAVTCSVYKSGKNGRNIFGLGGNVWEWCEDWYDKKHTYKIRVGGSWDFDGQPQLRITAKGFDRPAAAYDTIGIRLVVAPLSPPK